MVGRRVQPQSDPGRKQRKSLSVTVICDSQYGEYVLISMSESMARCFGSISRCFAPSSTF